MKNLTTDRQLDTHLKPLKSGEELSSLELSTKGSGVRITGDLEVTGEVTAGSFASNNFYHVMNAGWYGTNALIYMPLNGYTFEQTSPANYNESLAFVVPFDGELEFVLMRSEALCGISVVGFHLSTRGTETPNTLARQTVTENMITDDTTYKFNFAAVGSNTFTAGDIVAISFDPANFMYDTNATIVWKFYGNKPLGASE